MHRSPSLLTLIAVVTLVALTSSNLVFGGEIHVAAQNGDLEKVKALLKDKPDLVFSKDNTPGCYTPLHWAALKGRKKGRGETAAGQQSRGQCQSLRR